jgi:formate hydrogenlyase transcriptional activator
MSDEATVASAHLSRYDALQRISKILAGRHTMAELVRVLADHLHPLVAFDYLALFLYEEPTDEMRLVVLEPAGIDLPFVSMAVAAKGPAATVWMAQKSASIAIPEEGALHPVLEFIRTQGRRMTCWLPVTTARRRVGVLSFGNSTGAPYSEDVVAFMEQVAAGVAISIDNDINRDHADRYERELQEERDRLRFLLDVNNLLVTRLDYPDLLKVICEAVQRVIDADHIGIALYDRESRELRLELIYDKDVGFTRRTRRSDPGLSLDRSPAGVTFRRGVAAVFRRSELNALGWNETSVMKATGVESICCVPLVTSNGKLGTLLVGSARPDEFSESDVTLLGHTSAQIAIAIENARAYQRVVKLNAQLIDEKQYLEGELQNEFADIVAISPALRRVLKAVETVAPTDTTVLILGETGTGKELIARSIHKLSPRRAHTFVRTSVVALPSSLLESELFGHERGAFTGATASRAGRLELAHRGTLFLDEVGDIPGEMQPKLLRVLQEREFERLGSTRTQQVDVRIVAATNRDLERMAEDGSFRSDLYYRLNVFPITIPPLRDRVEDLPALARHFAAQCARRTGRQVPAISDAAMDALRSWSWPGNIRELQNVIERAVILTSGPELALPPDIQSRTRRLTAVPKPAATLKDAERETILRALRDSGGVIAGPSGAAAILGLRRTTLQSKMRKLAIRRPSY